MPASPSLLQTFKKSCQHGHRQRATISARMANQPIDDPAVMPTNTAMDSPASPSLGDAEKQDAQDTPPLAKKTSAFKSLGWLDRFLALWILLAMVLGVLLGNFVPDVGPALQKGKFADVSIPLGMPCPHLYFVISADDCCSCRAAGDDVSDPLQSAV
jgi:hypothetical protein